MRSIIFVIVTSALATAAAASLPALTATKEADEKKSPRRLGQTHAEPPISPTSPAEESDEETSSRRLGMTQVETAATPETVTYIIKFEDTAASPGDRCEALALANGGVVGHVYNEVVNGCSLTMPLAEVGVQSGDVIALGDYPKVASIEKDRKVWAFEDGEDNCWCTSKKTTGALTKSNVCITNRCNHVWRRPDQERTDQEEQGHEWREWPKEQLSAIQCERTKGCEQSNVAHNSINISETNVYLRLRYDQIMR